MFLHRTLLGGLRGGARSGLLGRRSYCPTPEEPLKPVAVQLWEQEQAKKMGLPPPVTSYVEKDSEVLDDPLYSPIPKVNTGT